MWWFCVWLFVRVVWIGLYCVFRYCVGSRLCGECLVVFWVLWFFFVESRDLDVLFVVVEGCLGMWGIGDG